MARIESYDVVVSEMTEKLLPIKSIKSWTARSQHDEVSASINLAVAFFIEINIEAVFFASK